jgi:hypothetical protein
MQGGDGQKKLPEGWLLSTSGSAPRLEKAACSQVIRRNARHDGREYNSAATGLSINTTANKKIYSFDVTTVVINGCAITQFLRSTGAASN